MNTSLHTPEQAHPTVFAHRGASASAPENTLAAFRLAHRIGADGIELDTRLSADGVPVVMHDAAVSRTTNGEGTVAAMTVAELKELDAGSWKDPRYAGERIPTLEEVFHLADDFRAINVEIKVIGEDVEAHVEKVVALIEQYDLTELVLISSFGAAELELAHALQPAIRTAFVFSGPLPESLPRGISAVHPHFAAVTPDFLAWARGKGYQVNPWTVDDPDEMRRLVTLGVDGIFTNVPDVLLNLFRL